MIVRGKLSSRTIIDYHVLFDPGLTRLGENLTTEKMKIAYLIGRIFKLNTKIRDKLLSRISPFENRESFLSQETERNSFIDLHLFL